MHVTFTEGGVHGKLWRLKEAGLWDDTLVVFLSDHGEMNMEHRQVWKNSHYEASARVPLIVRAPGGLGGPGFRNPDVC